MLRANVKECQGRGGKAEAGRGWLGAQCNWHTPLQGTQPAMVGASEACLSCLNRVWRASTVPDPAGSVRARRLAALTSNARSPRRATPGCAAPQGGPVVDSAAPAKSTLSWSRLGRL